MPGKHSAIKLAERRARAISRGFLVPKPREQDMKYVEVRDDVASRVKADAKALALHHDLNKITGGHFHFAAHAALAAKATIGDDAFKTAKAVIRTGNCARHRWADLDTDDGNLLLATSCSGAASSAPFDVIDPWANYLANRSSAGSRAPPASGNNQCAANSAPGIFENAKGDVGSNDPVADAWQQLALAQQQTITHLSHQSSYLIQSGHAVPHLHDVHSASTLSGFDARLCSMGAQVEALSNSMATLIRSINALERALRPEQSKVKTDDEFGVAPTFSNEATTEPDGIVATKVNSITCDNDNIACGDATDPLTRESPLPMKAPVSLDTTRGETEKAEFAACGKMDSSYDSHDTECGEFEELRPTCEGPTDATSTQLEIQHDAVDYAPLVERQVALPMWLLRSDPLNAGDIKACEFFKSGCRYGAQCRFSHLQSESDQSIHAEFDRLLSLNSFHSSVHPASAAQRRALISGRCVQDVLDMADRLNPCVEQPLVIPSIEEHRFEATSASSDLAQCLSATQPKSTERAKSVNLPQHSLPKPSKRFSHTPTRRKSSARKVVNERA